MEKLTVLQKFADFLAKNEEDKAYEVLESETVLVIIKR